MKNVLTFAVILILLILALSTCRKKPAATIEEHAETAAETKAVVRDTVETVTGYGEIKTYQRTKANIRNIDSQRQRDNAEAESLNE